jgi:hypothetical protein
LGISSGGGKPEICPHLYLREGEAVEKKIYLVFCCSEYFIEVSKIVINGLNISL